MLKILSLGIALILLAGCASKEELAPKKTKNISVVKKHKVYKAKKMFQTVTKKEAVLVQKGEAKSSCSVCGMNLVKFYKTSHIANHEDKPVQYCSIHCLASHLESGVEVENPKVVDVSSLKFIPVLQAYYVVGSSVHGTMSRVSKYAFTNLKDAQDFQAKNGGNIMDFQGALEKAKEDFK